MEEWKNQKRNKNEDYRMSQSKDYMQGKSYSTIDYSNYYVQI
jgi:hypothetical protein